MLTSQLSSQHVPFLRLHDTVQLALQMMSDNQVTHLPVADGDRFLGLVSEDDLLHVSNDQDELNTLQQYFGNLSVRSSDHFLKAIQIAAENNLSLIPVIDEENNISGSVVYTDLLKQASGFMSLNEPGGLIVLEVDSNQYSFNEINKLVETNDAQITQLNTTNDPATGKMQVTIRVNKPEISDIVATFQRYEYNVKYYFGDELYANEVRDNYDNLMNYLKI